MTKTKKLNFTEGDNVQGLILSDMREEHGNEILDRIEKIIKITDDDNGYFIIDTDYTESRKQEILELNKKKKKDTEDINTSWYVNAELNNVKVINKIKPENLKKVGAEIEGDFVVFEYMEIPINLLLSLKPFVDALKDKEIEEIIEVKDVMITIEGIELSIGTLVTIFG